jgi:HrpA-like RNA helicase
MIELRTYQKHAVENLHHKVTSALRSTENEVVIFQSPTGSGLTKNQAEDVLGDGWTVDVIAHIFSFLPEEYKK